MEGKLEKIKGFIKNPSNKSGINVNFKKILNFLKE
jgi:hypothetical protein